MTRAADPRLLEAYLALEQRLHHPLEHYPVPASASRMLIQLSWTTAAGTSRKAKFATFSGQPPSEQAS